MKLPDSSRSNKLISLLLIIATVVSIIYVPIISAGTGSESLENGTPSSSAYVAIMKDGYEISELTLNENEKITLSAYTEGCEGMKYQWQILDPADKTRWINIGGANAKTAQSGHGAKLRNLRLVTSENGAK